MIKTTMTAISITGPGGPEVLQPIEMAVPEPSGRTLLVKVEAAGINRPDVFQRQGLYPPPKGASDIPGLEISGCVVKCGPETRRFQEGDRICALVSGGGYSEYCLVEEGAALPVPATLSMIEAAALPESFFTVWHNVFERGGLQAGEWLLVHGGSSGIGTSAIQMASRLGARVLTTAGSPEKCAACEKLGATRAINYHQEDFVEVVQEVTEKHGADVILDIVGGDYIGRNIKCAANDGRIVQIAFLEGSNATINFMRIMLKRLTLTGSTLRVRTPEIKENIAKAIETKIWPLIEVGDIKPLIDSHYPLTEAEKAHQRMESGEHIGKIVLTL